MADESYVIPEEPVYHAAIRKILNEDPVNAEEILNPLVQALLENIHFVKLLAQAKAENSALDAHTGDDTAHLTAEERTAWNGKAEGDHRHTAEDVGALASDGTAAAAAKLVTARTIRTNLASTSAASFNGTANITPGVTGTLPIAHGGTGAATAAAAKTNLGIKDPKRTARFVVGTSTAGWTADQVDYLCDGTADQVEINAAITALPATGGEVVILDGTYNLAGSIFVNKSNVALSGNGQSTILKRAFSGTSSARGLIYITGSNNIIKFLSLDGVKSSYSGYYNDGIYLSGSSNNTLTGNICNNNNGDAIYLTSNSSNNTLIGNACNNNDIAIYMSGGGDNAAIGNVCNNNRYGIYLTGTKRNAIVGNKCNGNSDTGIYISAGNNAVTGNVCNNNIRYGVNISSTGLDNTVTGNICYGNENGGIYIGSARNNTIVGNTCSGNTGSGIYITGSRNNTVTGNTCNGNSQKGIYLISISNNTVTGNICDGNIDGINLDSSSDCSTITGNTLHDNTIGICVSSGKNNTITGNTCIRGTGATSDYTSSQYTIQVQANGKNNLIAANNIMGKNYTNSGTGNVFADNKYN